MVALEVVRTIMKGTCLSVMIASLSGCGTIKETIRAETNRGGGAFGYLGDQLMFPAENKHMQLFRAAVLVSYLSVVAEKFVTDENDAIAALMAIKASWDEIEKLNNRLNFRCEELSSNKEGADIKCKDSQQTAYPENFEAFLRPLESNIFRLAKISVPELDLEKLAVDITAANYLGTALYLTEKLAPTIETAHILAAINRSTYEIRADIVLESTIIANKHRNTDQPSRVESINAEKEQLFNIKPALERANWTGRYDELKNALGKTGTSGESASTIRLIPTSRSYDMIGEIINYSCKRIGMRIDRNSPVRNLFTNTGSGAQNQQNLKCTKSITTAKPQEQPNAPPESPEPISPTPTSTAG
ncbi:MAG TPA: hypothetical protein VEH84_13205 [Alphaproteobacteria bacterium]|nr:hypothetical protein [Alphaproteobacteria bacterium]